METKIDLTDLYERRLLVFIETKPQSNLYNQVLLTPEQFKNISDNTGVKKPSNKLKEGFELFETHISEEEYKLPDLNSIN